MALGTVHIHGPQVFANLLLADRLKSDLIAPAIDVVGQAASDGRNGDDRYAIAFPQLKSDQVDAVAGGLLLPSGRRSVGQGQGGGFFLFTLTYVTLTHGRMP